MSAEQGVYHLASAEMIISMQAKSRTNETQRDEKSTPFKIVLLVPDQEVVLVQVEADLRQHLGEVLET